MAFILQLYISKSHSIHLTNSLNQKQPKLAFDAGENSLSVKLLNAGLISCQLEEGNIDMASQQLDFLCELARTMDTPSELYYLTAVMAKIKNQSAETVLKGLNEALDAHFAKMRGLAFNITYLKTINPDLVIRIVKEYLLFAPQEVLT